jgi:peptidyl-prolyl cis-trans isomerase C
MMNCKRLRWAAPGLLSAPLVLCAGLALAGDLSDGIDGISVEEIRTELYNVPSSIRSRMSREQMSLYVENLLMDRRLAKAAAEAGIPQRPEVRARIEKATRDVVIRSYIDDELAKYAANLPDLKGLARERYTLNPAAYMKPEAIRVSHILFAVDYKEAGKSDEDAKAQAMAVLKQLRGGADFAALAKQYSDDKNSKRDGGQLKWAEKGKFVPPFEEAAFAMKPGEISDPVRTQFGYHIIRLDEKRAPEQQTFEEVEDKIVADLRKDLVNERRDFLIKQFRAKRGVELDNETWLDLQKP